MSRLLDELAADLKQGRWRPPAALRLCSQSPARRPREDQCRLPRFADWLVQAATKIVDVGGLITSAESCQQLTSLTVARQRRDARKAAGPELQDWRVMFSLRRDALTPAVCIQYKEARAGLHQRRTDDRRPAAAAPGLC